MSCLNYVRGFFKVFLSFSLFSLSTNAADPVWLDTQQLVTNEQQFAPAPATEHFGQVMFATNDFLVVGVPDEDKSGTEPDTGAVYLYYDSTGNGVFYDKTAQKLVATDAIAGDKFGFSVAISGNTLFVGAPGVDNTFNEEGAVYVFYDGDGDGDFSNASQQKLAHPSPDETDKFGFAVAAFNNGSQITLAVGVPFDDDLALDGDELAQDNGSVYVYVDGNNNNNFSDDSAPELLRDSAIATANKKAQNYFGSSIAISQNLSSGHGNTLVIGAYGHEKNDSFAGATYLYIDTNNDNAYGDQSAQLLTADTRVEHSYFGYSLAIEGNLLAIGAPFFDDSGSESQVGQVYVYQDTNNDGQYNNGGDVGEVILSAANEQQGNTFGFSLALKGTNLLVSAPGDDLSAENSGGVYLFEDDDGDFNNVQSQLIKVAIPSAGELLGNGLAYADKIYLGAPGFNDNNGSIYEFGSTEGYFLFISEDARFVRQLQASSDNGPVDYSLIPTAATPDDDQRLLFIGEQTGDLSFYNFPDFEAPGDIDINNIYEFEVQADNLDNPSVLPVKLLVTDVNDSTLSIANSQPDYFPFPAAVGAESSSSYGASMALSGRYLVIGDPDDDDNDQDTSNGTGSAIASGAIYVYYDDDNNGYFDDATAYKLKAADGVSLDVTAGDRFGTSLAMYDNVLVVGAPGRDNGGTDRGATYVFVDSNSDGVFENIGNVSDALPQLLTASDEDDGNQFGWSISIEKNRIAIGAPFDDNLGIDTGSVYIYEDNNLNNLYQPGIDNDSETKLTAGAQISGEAFGYAVKLYGDLLAVGAPQTDSTGLPYASDGAGYIYRDSDADGLFEPGIDDVVETRLQGLTPEAGDQFGFAIDVTNNRVVFGSPGFDTGGNIDSGIVFTVTDSDNNGIFDDGTSFALPPAPWPFSPDRFGSSVLIDGDILIAGAINGNIGTLNGYGAIFKDTDGDDMFDDEAGAMLFEYIDPPSDQFFATAVAMNKNNIFVGAPGYFFDDTTISGMGTVFSFQRTERVRMDGATLPEQPAGQLHINISDIMDVDTTQGLTFTLLPGDDYASFSINPLTGELNFNTTPTPGATYVVGIEIFDGSSYNYLIFEITIAAQAPTAPSWKNVKSLKPMDVLHSSDDVSYIPAENDEFASDVAISNNTLVVGSFSGAETGGTGNSGHVVSYYDNDGDGDFSNATVYPLDTTGLHSGSGLSGGYRFGAALALSGNILAIGANGANEVASRAGAVYVYVDDNNDGNFNDETAQELLPASIEEDERLAKAITVYDGSSVNLLAAGAPNDNNLAIDSGSVYVWVDDENDGDFSDETPQILRKDVEKTDDQFGSAVAARENIIAVSTVYDDSLGTNYGKVFVYVDDGDWDFTNDQPQHLLSPDLSGSAHLGHSLAIADRMIVAGANQSDEGGNKRGAVLIWYDSDNDQDFTDEIPQKITMPTPTDNAKFGSEVSVSDNLLIVGVQNSSLCGENSGSAYAYYDSDGDKNFAEETPQLLLAEDGSCDAEFGNTIAISGDNVVIGAHYMDVTSIDRAGAAYQYELQNDLFITIPEDQTQVATISAIDINADVITYSKSGLGADEALFSVDPASGLLTFDSVPSFESPTDTGADNVYNLILRASANGDDTDLPVTLVIKDLDPQPTATADGFNVNEEDTVSDDVLTNDFDVEGQLPLNIALLDSSGDPLSMPQTGYALDHGTLDINADGTFTYTHDGSENFTDSFNYQVSDNSSICEPESASVSLNINPVNDQPIADDDSATVNEGSSVVINVRDGDNDAETATSSLVITNLDTNPPHGTVSDNGDGTVTYTHNGNTSTTDSFTYTINDGALDSATATVTVTINSQNDAPTASNGNENIIEGASVLLDLRLLGNDEETAQANLAVSSLSAVSHGSLLNNGNGTVTYSHGGAETSIDSFNFTLQDANGTDSNLATVTINITNTNDTPVATADSATVDEDNSVLIDLTDNVSDEETAAGSLQIRNLSSPINGALTNNNDGTVTYTHNGSESTSDSFTYTVFDGSIDSASATVSLSINPINDAPVATNDAGSVLQGASVTITLSDNLSDVDNPPSQLTITNLSTPAYGTATNNNDGTVTYTHDNSANFSDSFTYTAFDGSDNSVPATVTITVTPTNTAPVANNDSVTVNEGNSVSFNITDNDTDAESPSSSLTVNLLSSVSHGTLTPTGNGNFTYSHNGTENFTDSFTYELSDGALSSNTATVSININSTNDVPVVSDINLTTDEDQPVSFTLTGTDSDNDELTFAITSAVDDGELSGQSPNFIFTPATGFSGIVSFNYTASDGISESVPATIDITVNPVNDSPVAQAIAVTTAEDTSVMIMLMASDLDNDSLTYSLESLPKHGELTGSAPDLSYVPEDNFHGEDTFTFTASDGEKTSPPETVTITVTEVNDAPEAVDDFYQFSSDGMQTLDVLKNDSDVDGDTLSISGATASIGQLSWHDELLTYTPKTGFNGEVMIDYYISDGELSDKATAILTFAFDNSLLPVITPPSDLHENATALFTRLDLGVASAIDRFGNPLPVSLLDGETLFKPGVNTAFWQAIDSDGNSAIASQQVNVNPLISIDLDQIQLEGAQVSVGVFLNGIAPDYPLEIPYSVSGSATPGEDHDLTSGTISITQGSVGYIRFNLLNDTIADDNESVVITLDESINRGVNSSHTLTILEQNINPIVKLDAKQGGETRLIVEQGDMVTITSAIFHPNSEQTYHYDWQNHHTEIADLDDKDDTYSFDPALLAPGTYQFSLSVTDTSDSRFGNHATIYLEVVDILMPLSDSDSDMDGLPDNIEGYKDTDGDGTPDYLDFIPECNVIQSSIDDNIRFLLESAAGSCLRIGNLALGGDSGGAKLTGSDFNENNTLIDDVEVTNVGGIFNFIGYSLSEDENNLTLVIPQENPIPADAVYRKLMPGPVWQTFIETTNDKLLSAAGEPGFCPPPGSAAWQPGLIEGFWCVQVIIEDGGVNDADGLLNNAVSDPGGVGVFIDTNQLPVALDDQASTRINQLLSINVLDNDSDADGDELVISSAHSNVGQVSIVNQHLEYQPLSNYTGQAAIIYGITDQNGGTAQASVVIDIVDNQAPIAVDDKATLNVNSSITLSPLSNDSDPEGDRLHLISASANNGVATITNDTTVSYTPNKDYIGDDIISYVIEDSFGDSAAAQITVKVTALPPVTAETSGGGGGSLPVWSLITLMLIFVARVRYNLCKV